MVPWLENDEDKLSDVELWRISKPVYGFSDFLEWLANNGEGLIVDTVEQQGGHAYSSNP